MNIEIGDSRGEVWETVHALVDTGSTYTWIPRQLLEMLHVHSQFQREFETADGRIVQRDTAVTMVRWDGETMPTLVVFGGDTDAVLLGAYTLEGFALACDPVNRRLASEDWQWGTWSKCFRLCFPGRISSADPWYRSILQL